MKLTRMLCVPLEVFLLFWDSSPGASFTEAVGKNVCSRKTNHLEVTEVHVYWMAPVPAAITSPL